VETCEDLLINEGYPQITEISQISGAAVKFNCFLRNPRNLWMLLLKAGKRISKKDELNHVSAVFISKRKKDRTMQLRKS
jgi:hypothetical protein